MRFCTCCLVNNTKQAMIKPKGIIWTGDIITGEGGTSCQRPAQVRTTRHDGLLAVKGRGVIKGQHKKRGE